jgi:hypothetical protein
MKLSQDSIKKLDALLQAAAYVNIDKLILSKNSIRGIDDKKSVALITDQNVPDFGDFEVGLNRLPVLADRLNLVKNDDKCTVDVVESAQRLGEVQSLTLASTSAKVQYRCSSAEAIRGVPKAINDTIFWLVTLDPSNVPTIQQAAGAMAADRLIVTAKQDGVYFEFMDTNSDTFSMKISDTAEWIPPDQDAKPLQFVTAYPIKSCLPLIRAAAKDGPVKLLFGERGIMSIDVNGYTFMVLPTDD